jgi:hypothetical protein
MSLADVRARTLLCVLAGYIMFNYSFMQLRFPPEPLPGIPLGDMGLIFCLATINVRVVLTRMRGAINLTPFLIWWCFGLGRAIVDGFEYGIWAFRDAAQVIESLWLIVAFAVAQKAENVARLFRWLNWLLVAYCVYAVGKPFQDTIASISPSIPTASGGELIPVIGLYANLPLMLLWTTFYLVITEHKNQLVRSAAIAVACLMIGFVVIVVQARTTYFQLAALMCIVGLFRRKSVGRFGMVIPIMFIVLGIITAFNIKVPGKLTDKVSFSFIIQQLETIGGMAQGGEEGLNASATGVPLRLGWWTNILEQESADAVALITGLGYGKPLTNYAATNIAGTGGVAVREPHNSFISVLGRLGIVGAISWTWLHIELFKLWRKVFLYYRGVKGRVWINRMLLMLAFVALVLAWAVGEDALEKPFNIMPYYCFWGVILRLGVNTAAARTPVLAEGRYYTAAESGSTLRARHASEL